MNGPEVSASVRGYLSEKNDKESPGYYFVRFENHNYLNTCVVRVGDLVLRCSLSALEEALRAVRAGGQR